MFILLLCGFPVAFVGGFNYGLNSAIFIVSMVFCCIAVIKLIKEHDRPQANLLKWEIVCVKDLNSALSKLPLRNCKATIETKRIRDGSWLTNLYFLVVQDANVSFKCVDKLNPRLPFFFLVGHTVLRNKIETTNELNRGIRRDRFRVCVGLQLSSVEVLVGVLFPFFFCNVKCLSMLSDEYYMLIGVVYLEE